VDGIGVRGRDLGVERERGDGEARGEIFEVGVEGGYKNARIDD